ncbi:hypothetical protein B0H11DRAFT_1929719 [Mycena galericulata]|nr:hypothetical protein B0H11DRAFT_1929719 [Mycena galericulata]
MNTYSTEPAKLVARSYTPAEQTLDAEILQSGIKWQIDDDLGVPYCEPLDECDTCFTYLDHLGIARYGPKRKKDVDSSGEEGRAETDTDPMGMGRLEGAIVEQVGNRLDALRERDDAVCRLAVGRKELNTSKEGYTQLETFYQLAVQERDNQLAAIIVLETKLTNAVAEREHAHAAVKDLEAQLEQGQDSFQEIAHGLEELNQRSLGLLEDHQQDQATIAELQAQVKLLENLGTEDDQSSRKRRRTTAGNYNERAVSRLPNTLSNMKLDPPESSAKSHTVTPTATLPSGRRAWSSVNANRRDDRDFSNMKKPTADDPPESLARWLQFNKSAVIKGVTVSEAVPGRYADGLQKTAATIAGRPSLTPCAFTGARLSDSDVVVLLAAKGLTAAAADDAWQFCYKFVNAQAQQPDPPVSQSDMHDILRDASEVIKTRGQTVGNPTCP